MQRHLVWLECPNIFLGRLHMFDLKKKSFILVLRLKLKITLICYQYMLRITNFLLIGISCECHTSSIPVVLASSCCCCFYIS